MIGTRFKTKIIKDTNCFGLQSKDRDFLISRD
jgi:hypothetical protein